MTRADVQLASEVRRTLTANAPNRKVSSFRRMYTAVAASFGRIGPGLLPALAPASSHHSADMAPYVITLALLVALLHLAAAQTAPWPVFSHDSALTFAAPAGTPVHARYCAHKLSMEPLSGPLVMAPDTVASASLLKSGACGGRLLENASESRTPGHWQVDADGPLQRAWLSFIGFSSAGACAFDRKSIGIL